MSIFKRLTTTSKVILVVLLVVLCTFAITALVRARHRDNIQKTAQQAACERAASAPKPSAHDAPLEGESIDAAICQGSIQPVTPAQSQ